MVAFSHGETVEMMVWKYSKASKRVAEEIVNESRAANVNNLWHFYQPNSKEYQDGFRICFKFDAEVTHV